MQKFTTAVNLLAAGTLLLGNALAQQTPDRYYSTQHYDQDANFCKASNHRSQERDRSDTKNAKRKIQLRSRDEDRATDGRKF